MTKRKRNLFSEFMEGIDAMREHHKERRDVGREILDGVGKLKWKQHGQTNNKSDAEVAKVKQHRSKRSQVS